MASPISVRSARPARGARVVKVKPASLPAARGARVHPARLASYTTRKIAIATAIATIAAMTVERGGHG